VAQTVPAWQETPPQVQTPWLSQVLGEGQVLAEHVEVGQQFEQPVPSDHTGEHWDPSEHWREAHWRT
jgi:hypothetical protein